MPRPRSRLRAWIVLSALALAPPAWAGEEPAADPGKAPDPQAKPAAPAPTTQPPHDADPFLKESEPDFEAKLKAAVESIKPLPEVPIPDDPPPHEGAFFDLPYVIEPPDLLRVEVLEASPGRPIQGERLVRPDGTIDLGFYGVVHVRGLTESQAKVKVIQHLRRFFPDEVLGLQAVKNVSPTPPAAPPGSPYEVHPPAAPPRLPDGVHPSEVPRPAGPQNKGGASKSSSNGRPGRRPVVRHPVRPSPGVRLTGFADDPAPPHLLTIPAGGEVTIMIRVQGPPVQDPLVGPNPPPGPPAAPEVPEEPFKIFQVAPADSDRVFVEVTAFDSKFYYVQGHVNKPGRIPFTGQDTVLDVLNYSGGLAIPVEQADIRLVRPARGGKPAKVYPIDYKAITEEGDRRKNYQLFPGDRIIVGGSGQAQAANRRDQPSTDLSTFANAVTQAATAARALVDATPDLTPAQREAALTEWIDATRRSASRTGGPEPDEASFRELLLWLIRPAPKPGKPDAAPR